MSKGNVRKIFISMIVILYFVVCWVIYHWSMPGYFSSGEQQIYLEHDTINGYYSISAHLVLYIAPLLCYILRMLREDQAYIAIRYLDREEIWRYKIFHTIIYIFQFTIIQFGVDIAAMFCCYPLSEVRNSRVLNCLAVFLPNVFFFYIFFTSIFLICQNFYSTKKSLLLTVGIAAFIDLFLVPFWNPFFFLSLLSLQMQDDVKEADFILSYINILSLDTIVVFMGLNRYYNKIYIH